MRRSARWVSDLPNARVPFAELRRTLQLWRDVGYTDVSVGYERRGRWRVVQDAFADPDLMQALPVWERKLLAFRAVDEDGRESSCRW